MKPVSSPSRPAACGSYSSFARSPEVQVSTRRKMKPVPSPSPASSSNCKPSVKVSRNENNEARTVDEFFRSVEKQTDIGKLPTVVSITNAAQNGTLNYGLLPQMVKLKPEWIPSKQVGEEQALYIPLQSFGIATPYYPPALKVCKLTSATRNYADEISKYYQAVMASLNKPPEEQLQHSFTYSMAPHVELPQKVRSALDELYRQKQISERLERVTLEKLSELPLPQQLYVVDQYSSSAGLSTIDKQNGFFRGIVKRVREKGIPIDSKSNYLKYGT